MGGGGGDGGQPPEPPAILCTISSPQRVEINRYVLPDQAHTIGFTAPEAGEYTVCLILNKPYIHGNMGVSQQQYRMQLSITSGAKAIDYSQLAKAEHLSAIEVEVRKLLDRTQKIRAEQDYQRKREEEFRNVSEIANSRVAWYNILIAILLISGGVFQSMFLKQFFTKKKLV
jgi:hypothetical protein